MKNFGKLCIATVVAGMAGGVMAQEQIIKIGHIGPTSGPQAHFGKDDENGVRMAIEDLNAKGMEIGGKKVKFVLVAEDDVADPKQGTAASQKLCDDKVAGAVAFVNSGVAIPSSKVFQDCGIPMITGAATNPDLTKPGWNTTYRVIANDNALGAALATYAAKNLKLKNVAVIDDRTAYGQGLANVFKKDAEKQGIKIVANEFTNDKATDFMAILTSIKAKKPDAIFYGGMYGQAGPMLRQMAQLGMNDVKMFGGDGICVTELAKVAAGAKPLENVVCADGGASIAKMPGGTEWKKRYDAKYPGQFQVYSPYFYDGTMLLADAMKRANSWDPKVYIPFLQKSDYSGVTSKIQFEKNGEMKNPSYTLSRYVGGNKTPIDLK
ncbi:MULTISPECIES: branched-chain amino acid ABC transporter substrate-binding protein [Comamonas]|uniref:Leucine-, isoleucine-, valine-, threonine-, and alanine-binding protein n=1 Tax=Comamonas testosteroni TaxID=285 RepID=A0A8B4S7F7_COMTE|nr:MULTISPECIES: branched-chain amino acid ABC transporter substrate-binding protein [Comamonas]EHN64169.1 extracellular ligand-binding receptor [Comamonas testosteroni ATCC 11996]QQN67693.1 branched-chain amino acid ABC transporter substrate-binding protein [Comamonas testosteroni]RDI06804.1 amino acid/amide ABC transporter substrate-binding protein (HAAT family) [Comamonas sp. AG1104]SUY79124.1 Leucine-, isoleucine-, valine-, threonine-, and alanine-binding protein precursor [Comamonas testos